MRLLRVSFLSFALAAAPAALTLVPTDANASVMIAVSYDALVKDADAVAIASAQDASSVWEDGRIVTYTHMKVEQTVAGDPQGEVWVRSLGGVVGKIGQMVDGEPVLPVGKSSMLFLRKFKTAGTWEVSARAQGQFPIVIDDATKVRKIIRNANAGLILPPKATAADGVQPQTVGIASHVRLAHEVLHDRPLADAAKDIAAAWKLAHPTTAK